MNISALPLLIAMLGVWRISSLAANETGPFHIFKRFRVCTEQWCERYWFCRELHLDELVSCEWCNSIWFALPVSAAWYFLGDIVVWCLVPLAISTGVIFLKYVIQTLEQIQEYAEGLNKARTEVR